MKGLPEKLSDRVALKTITLFKDNLTATLIISWVITRHYNSCMFITARQYRKSIVPRLPSLNTITSLLAATSSFCFISTASFHSSSRWSWFHTQHPFRMLCTFRRHKLINSNKLYRHRTSLRSPHCFVWPQVLQHNSIHAWVSFRHSKTQTFLTGLRHHLGAIQRVSLHTSHCISHRTRNPRKPYIHSNHATAPNASKSRTLSSTNPVPAPGAPSVVLMLILKQWYFF